MAPAVAVEVVGLPPPGLGERPQILRDRAFGEVTATAHERIAQRSVESWFAGSSRLIAHAVGPSLALGRAAVVRTRVTVSSSVSTAVTESSHNPIA